MKQDNTTKKEAELLVNDSHGIYIAQSFCKIYSNYITNMNEIKEDFEICLQGPDHAEYWEAWENLINNVKCTNDTGEKFTIGNLGDSGDLWAIPENFDYSEYE